MESMWWNTTLYCMISLQTAWKSYLDNLQNFFPRTLLFLILIGLSFFINERPYLIRGLNLMILFCGFCGWIRLKTMDFGRKLRDFSWKPRISKIVGGANCQNPRFQLKTMDFFAEDRGFFCRKPQIFCRKLRISMKTADFGQNRQFLAKNCGFLAENHGFHKTDFSQKPRIL